jgi:dipeptidyl aminopeptidase/acylaminoacyl peptidase
MKIATPLSALLSLALLAACGSSEDKPDDKPTQAATAQAAAEAPPPKKSMMPAPTVDDALISRDLLFGNPERTRLRISPDGKHLSYLAPKDGVLNVFVAPTGKLGEAKAITDDKLRGIRFYAWAADAKHVLYVQDSGGDENWHVHAVSLDGGEAKDLTPYEGVNASIGHISPKKKGEVVIAMNDRDKRFHDPYVVDIKSGKRTILETNDKGFFGYEIDDDFKVHLAIAPTPTGGMKLLKKSKKGFEDFIDIAPEDMMSANSAGLDAKAKNLYLIDSTGRDKSALFSVSLKDGKRKLLAESADADVNGAIVHPTTKKVEGATFNHTRRGFVFADKKVEAHFAELGKLGDGDWLLVDRTLDGKTWVVARVRDDGPTGYYVYDTKKKKAELQFEDRPELNKVELTKMHPRVLDARDGKKLVSYLSLPKASDPDADGKPDAAQPMVLYVHGGPWARDSWGFNSMHQWLADRGYAVLSVNYRGSMGFGKDFTNAADGQWAGTMHDDLIDAVQWAVKEGVADPKRVAIMGGSYGGYATLVGLTFTPEQFTCGVDIVGPSNLVTLLNNIPPYWAPFFPVLKTKVGDPTTEEGKKFLAERSPLTKVDAIQRPLLIGQGANDPRVKQQESDQIVQAMEKKSIPVTYVLYPDEGHGFARPPNRMSFFAVSETFLSQCLGGKSLPLAIDEGSTIQVPNGAEQVHGLTDLLN